MEITLAVGVPADSFKIPLPTGAASSVSHPAFCRVQGVLSPTKDSSIQFEVWMPLSGWNGRFEQIGNGGYAGEVPYKFMIPELRRGFAIAGTDDGHRKGIDQSWSIHHPEKVIDFGYRAVHATSERAKMIIAAFYGNPPAYSYFDGCSDGGREALMEAQRFPSDFNGIIAGAPANFWTHLMASGVWNERAILGDQASYIPANKLPSIQAASLAACDALDGVKDGLVEDPLVCHFDPAVLLCKGTDNADCLTPLQVETARKLYSGPSNPKTGKKIFPGEEPGAEAAITDWPEMIIGTWPIGGWEFPVGNMFFSDLVFERPSWDFRSFDFDNDVATADAKLSGTLNSTDPDLQPFKDRGGKLIQYHGWADAVIAPRSSIDYYQNAVKQMGGLEKTQEFYRLYMVPGLSHCAGGPGPNNFGAILQHRAADSNAEDDIDEALIRWVEQGIAPDKIVATKFNEDDPAKGVLLTRPLCPFPQRATWTGIGSTNDAVNFVCK